MLSVRAIYDGKTLKLIDKVNVRKPKQVILTFLENEDSDYTSSELHYLSLKSGALDFLKDEKDIYSDKDLKVRYK